MELANFYAFSYQTHLRKHRKNHPWFDPELCCAFPSQSCSWRRYRDVQIGYDARKQNSVYVNKMARERVQENIIIKDSVITSKQLYGFLGRILVNSVIFASQGYGALSDTDLQKAEVLARHYPLGCTTESFSL